jgi:hypothetical protein
MKAAKIRFVRGQIRSAYTYGVTVVRLELVCFFEYFNLNRRRRHRRHGGVYTMQLGFSCTDSA